MNANDINKIKTEIKAMRIKPQSDNQALKKEAHKSGYKYIGYWGCEACTKELGLAAGMVDWTNGVPPWGNMQSALKFHKKGSTIAACRCGWRKDITIKFTGLDKVQCKVRGCHAILGKLDTDGLCAKCRNEIAGGGNPATYSAGCKMKPEKGCFYYVQEGKAACIRIQCPEFDANVKPSKVCNRKGCNNPVPEGRKAVCYSCQPAPKKEPASSDFPM